MGKEQAASDYNEVDSLLLHMASLVSIFYPETSELVMMTRTSDTMSQNKSVLPKVGSSGILLWRRGTFTQEDMGLVIDSEMLLF